MTPGQGVREDQRRDPRPLAHRESRRRGSRSFRDQAPGLLGCAQISEVQNEALWPAEGNRDRPASHIPGCGEDDWYCCADIECDRWLDNGAGNAYQPFRRREGATSKFGDAKTLQPALPTPPGSSALAPITAILPATATLTPNKSLAVGSGLFRVVIKAPVTVSIPKTHLKKPPSTRPIPLVPLKSCGGRE